MAARHKIWNFHDNDDHNLSWETHKSQSDCNLLRVVTSNFQTTEKHIEVLPILLL
jgi:hypothetical protein